jgi:hypothetical protein
VITIINAIAFIDVQYCHAGSNGNTVNAAKEGQHSDNVASEAVENIPHNGNSK